MKNLRTPVALNYHDSLTHAVRKRKCPHSPHSDQTEGEAGTQQQRKATSGIIASHRAARSAERGDYDL